MWNTVSTCLLSSRLFAGVSLKLSGGEDLLLGYVSVVRCWCSMLLLATVQVLLKFCCFPNPKVTWIQDFVVNQVGAFEGR